MVKFIVSEVIGNVKKQSKLIIFMSIKTQINLALSVIGHLEFPTPKAT